MLIHGRCISVLCNVHNFTFRICNVHAPHVTTLKKRFFYDLYLYTRGNDPLILAGDFNCILDASDRVSLSYCAGSFVGSNEIRDLISTFNLYDGCKALHHSPCHTWFRRSSGQSSRIDRVYLDKCFTEIKADAISLPSFRPHSRFNVDLKFPCDALRKKSYWKYNVSFKLK